MWHTDNAFLMFFDFQLEIHCRAFGQAVEALVGLNYSLKILHLFIIFAMFEMFIHM